MLYTFIDRIFCFLSSLSFLLHSSFAGPSSLIDYENYCSIKKVKFQVYGFYEK